MATRLGLDLGTNSIGWCLLTVDDDGNPTGIEACGVRIFSDGRNPKDGSSLAAGRRQARGMRRRRDRYLRRRTALFKALVGCGLLPADPVAQKDLQTLDPYQLRAAALDQALPPYHLGRALFHLDQRRGFKSNRKAIKDAKEEGKVKESIGKLAQHMETTGARTFGEYLWRRRRKGKTVRARDGLDLRPSREMLEREFDHIRAAQAPHQAISPETWNRLRRIIFFQRPLKPVPVGRCTLVPSDERAPKALPLAQRFRILSEIANLRVMPPSEPERPLAADEHERLFDALLQRQKLDFDQIAKLLKLPGDTRFNLLSEKRDHLKGDETASVLSAKDRFGPAWRTLAVERQTAIVERLIAPDAEDAETLIAEAIRDWGLSEAAARRVVDARLPAGYGRLGRQALSRLVPLMHRLRLGYADAVMHPDSGFTGHSGFDGAGTAARLPYYGQVLERHTVGGDSSKAGSGEGRYGRLGNPTVHIALNQLRRVVNAVIRAYGKPDDVVVELARELKLSGIARAEVKAQQAKEDRRNRALNKLLEDCNLPPGGENLRKLKLWEDLGPVDHRLCPYSLQPIGLKQLLSDEVEIDHILPFARTWDDSMANKTVCFRWANRLKGKRTPHQAFSGNSRFDFAAVLANADRLPKNKRWRFHPDALDRFAGERNFLARQLNETRYTSRLAREYLSQVVPPNRIWVIPGTLTALLRGKWGLNGILSDHNRKIRTDHRHHAIDALVTALTTRGMLNRVSRAADASRERIIDHMPEPWPGYHAEAAAKIRTVVVSYKPDHGTPGGRTGRAQSSTTGQLHNDTAMGLIGETDRKGYLVVNRVPLASLKPADLSTVRNQVLAGRLQALWADCRAQGDTWAMFAAKAAQPTVARDRLGMKHGVRSVRVLGRMADPVPIRDAAGRIYKVYKGDSNHCADIWCGADGKWRDEVISTFAVNQAGFAPDWQQCGGALLMRLHKDDLLAIDSDGERRIVRVVKFSNGRVVLANHQEGGPLKSRDTDPDDPFKYLNASATRLQSLQARKVHVDELGRVHDPGPLP